MSLTSRDLSLTSSTLVLLSGLTSTSLDCSCGPSSHPAGAVDMSLTLPLEHTACSPSSGNPPVSGVSSFVPSIVASGLRS
ncbi:hypothetical protein EDC04DRAFT_2691327 [Pisolithus marmoratus]|nr:hypothetical protein EDC04DRAFT_2691327 [Pisolithus marmoratus]